MCRFKSAIALRDPNTKDGFRLLHNAWTDSHSDLIALNNLKDGARLTFARVELYPDDPSDVAKPEKYILHIDEERTPEWFTDERRAKCEEIMRGWIKSMIVTDTRELLCGGAYILAGAAVIRVAKNCYIPSISGSAKIGSVYGSAKIDYVYGSAKIGSVYGFANIGSVSGSAKIGSVSGFANIGSVSGSANIGSVSGSAKIGSVYDSAKIENDKRRH